MTDGRRGSSDFQSPSRTSSGLARAPLLYRQASRCSCARQPTSRLNKGTDACRNLQMEMMRKGLLKLRPLGRRICRLPPPVISPGQIRANTTRRKITVCVRGPKPADVFNYRPCKNKTRNSGRRARKRSSCGFVWFGDQMLSSPQGRRKRCRSLPASRDEDGCLQGQAFPSDVGHYHGNTEAVRGDRGV